jgi:hypothetical protein
MKKKGISIMISYVLLIAIAVGLSASLYVFLKVYIPKDKPECKDGIDIAVANVDYCANGILGLSLQNRGRFKIGAAYIRLGKQDREYREWLNDPNDPNVDYQHFYFFDPANGPGLFPGETTTIGPFTSSVVVDADAKYLLEVQPAIFTGDEVSIEDLALCPAITQEIDCTLT